MPYFQVFLPISLRLHPRHSNWDGADGVPLNTKKKEGSRDERTPRLRGDGVGGSFPFFQVHWTQKQMFNGICTERNAKVSCVSEGGGRPPAAPSESKKTLQQVMDGPPATDNKSSCSTRRLGTARPLTDSVARPTPKEI